MKREIKPIHGFPGYLISNYGEVYSLWYGSGIAARIGESPHRLKTSIDKKDGRECITLSRNKKRLSRKICRLVLTVFVGICPEGFEACHFPDRNPSNNRLDNLRWDSKASNYADRIEHKTCNRGVRNGSAKLNPAQVRQILKRKNNGETYLSLATEYGVSLSAVQQICERRTWIWL